MSFEEEEEEIEEENEFRLENENRERNQISLIFQIFVGLFIILIVLFIPQFIYYIRLLEILG